MSPLAMILTEAQMAASHETKKEVIAVLIDVRHRASYDACVIQETWQRRRDAEC